MQNAGFAYVGGFLARAGQELSLMPVAPHGPAFGRLHAPAPSGGDDEMRWRALPEDHGERGDLGELVRLDGSGPGFAAAYMLRCARTDAVRTASS